MNHPTTALRGHRQTNSLSLVLQPTELEAPQGRSQAPWHSVSAGVGSWAGRPPSMLAEEMALLTRPSIMS